MHELSIAQNILSIVNSRVEKEGIQLEATAVTVMIGEFRNVDPESLEFAFDAMKPSFEFCRNCLLKIISVKAEGICTKSMHSFHPEKQNGFSCPICNSAIKEFKSGEELDIVRIIISTIDQGRLECTK